MNGGDRLKRVNLRRKHKQPARGVFATACCCWSIADPACQSAGKIRPPQHAVPVDVLAPDALSAMVVAGVKARQIQLKSAEGNPMDPRSGAVVHDAVTRVSAATVESELAALLADGVAVLPGVLAADEVTEVRRALLAALRL